MGHSTGAVEMDANTNEVSYDRNDNIAELYNASQVGQSGIGLLHGQSCA